jgi:NAD(P)-dependent dehydrogenase (short-subunit alcohol dehydrogenase family)
VAARRDVNNAGYVIWKSLETTTMAEWNRTLLLTSGPPRICVRRSCRTCRATLRAHRQHRQRGRRFQRSRLAAYCVSKQALVALTEVIQDANHDNGIKAWVVCPGFVD